MKYIHFITKAFSEIPPKMSFDGFSKDFAEVCRQFVEICRICRLFGDLVDNLTNFAHDLPKFFLLGSILSWTKRFQLGYVLYGRRTLA